ncbi:hypothetical protein RB2520 [Rhodopirellula baltica SH 1]|uniref:Uncharacterized protein n=1 Tax=Rhodopirellula baltica (strain DSM 10527 / NCIMB 13988 / SH1) TaxID=243090 RepID=Q7UVN1_RHOBA|nr:hypothetical protein RB2520 [Rhodopirellula baltica SH 1]
MSRTALAAVSQTPTEVNAEWHLLHPPSGRVGPLRAGEGEPKTRWVALPSLRSTLPEGGWICEVSANRG